MLRNSRNIQPLLSGGMEAALLHLGCCGVGQGLASVEAVGGVRSSLRFYLNLAQTSNMNWQTLLSS